MKIAFVFPGQGSQTIGMMNSFAENAAVRETFVEASSVLGMDLWQLAAQGPEAELNRTINTQPLMLTADIAIYRAWQALGGKTPEVMAGHSLGEYAALVAAEALSLQEALPLVQYRAQVMQEAVPEGEGAMAAILGLADPEVIEACKAAAQTEVVEAVNFNAPSQVVIAGHKNAVLRAIDEAKIRGAKRGMLLPVSAPFHSSLLRSAAEQLAARLTTVVVKAPRIPVLHNVDLSVSSTPDAVRAALAKQAASAVRWVETIERMVSDGVSCFVECGPGKVLTGMVKRIAPSVEVLSVNDPAALQSVKVAID